MSHLMSPLIRWKLPWMKYGVCNDCGHTFSINKNPFERWQRKIIYTLGGSIIGYVLCFFIGIAGTVCGYPFARRADILGAAVGGKIGYDLADRSFVECPKCKKQMKA
jgi:hypothetical protein